MMSCHGPSAVAKPITRGWMVPNGFTLLLMILGSSSVIAEQLVPPLTTHISMKEMYINAEFLSDLQPVVYSKLAKWGTW